VIEWGTRQEAERLGAKVVKAFSAKDMEEQLLTLFLEEYTLKETFGPDYPPLKSVRKRIDLARSMLSRQIEERAKEGGSFGEGEEKRAKELVELYIESLKQELVDTTRAEENLAELFARESSEARKLTKFEVEDEEYRNAIGRMQQLFNGIVKRLQDVDLLTNFGGYDARIIRPAGNGLKVSPKAILIFPMALFLGLLVGGGLAYMADIRDKSFRSPEEIRHRLGLPVVGHIPLLAATSNGVEKDAAHELALDSSLCTYYRTKSGEAEAFRGLRTALFFSMRGEGHKVIQITSPSMGDGKSTLAANLAVSVAQTGKKVLLIDADFRKPRIHKLFGLTARVGMATVLISETEAGDAIQASGIPGLDILPCGPIPPNPAELLGLTRVKELLDLFREQYDLVLVDSAPLLVVTDPCIVAAHVDGLLLTIRITSDSRPAAERSREILATLGARVLGIIVNGMDAQAGYSRYGYGSYYSSSYYRSNGKNGYYQNSESDDIPNGAITSRIEDSATNKPER
ncbi:MAG TPA: polysaccharide biosynthesis tyrosine autokinase, partial [Gemmataceae bacterium]|nr:polysaccharide biosynthesis tyrosine autokinase [Gemmataceae bacterium]